VNAALLLMTSAWMAGADAAPQAVAPAPAVIVAGCTDCAAPVAECNGCGKAGLLDRLKAKFKSVGGHKSKGCETCETCTAPPAPAPAPCAVPAPCDTCADPCGGHKAGFLDKLKAKLGGLGGHKSKGCDTCETSVAATSGCATPGAPATAPAAPADAPKEMPKPATPKPATPKTTSIILPIPTAPVTPVSGPRLSGTTNPF